MGQSVSFIAMQYTFITVSGETDVIELDDGRCFLFNQEFEDHRDADDAVYELNGKDLCGDR